MIDIITAWQEFVYTKWKNTSNAKVFHETIEGTWKNIPFTYKDIGYTKQKHTKLTNTYLIPGSIDNFKEHYANIGSNCSVLRFGNTVKKGSHRDFCLVGIAISKHREKPQGIDIYYRNTELAVKFAADLVFIQSIIDQIGYDLEGLPCRIHLPSAYLQRINLPIYLIICHNVFKDNPIKKFKWAEKFIKEITKRGYHTSYASLERNINKYKSFFKTVNKKGKKK